MLAKNAVERGLSAKPWVKTSMAPGSKVVTDYYEKAGHLALPREARLPPGRLWLHDLHRQLRAAGRGGLGGHPGARPQRRLGPVRQPQLRGPDQPRYQDELPRVATAGRGVRACGHDGLRPRVRAARHRPCTASTGIPARHLAAPGRRRGHAWSTSITKEMFSSDYADVFAGDERWRSLPTPEGETFDWDAGVDLRAQASVLRRHEA